MASAAPFDDALEPAPLELLFEQRFAARLEVLKKVRASVLAGARHCGFGEADARDIVLALDEACKNILVHAYRNDEDGEIVLAVFRCEAGMVLLLRDFARPIDPTGIRPRDLADVRPGKLGTHFIHSIMDSVEFKPAPDGQGNQLRLVKRLE
jgi:sigma-B regulation protein RsbU (phosphoserine phosphatase)